MYRQTPILPYYEIDNDNKFDKLLTFPSSTSPPMSNWEYRQLMQHQPQPEDDSFSSLFTEPHHPPFMYKSVHDNRRPPFGYHATDLKQSYLSKEQFRSRMVSSVVTFKKNK